MNNNMVAQFYLLQTITWLLAMVVWRQKSSMGENTCWLLAVLIAMVMHQVQYNLHCPIEEVQGFKRSHWIPPLFECWRCIAPAAALVINFGWIKNTTKTQQLASNCTVLSIQKREKFITQKGPPTKLIHVTRFMERDSLESCRWKAALVSGIFS